MCFFGYVCVFFAIELRPNNAIFAVRFIANVNEKVLFLYQSNFLLNESAFQRDFIQYLENEWIILENDIE